MTEKEDQAKSKTIKTINIQPKEKKKAEKLILTKRKKAETIRTINMKRKYDGLFVIQVFCFKIQIEFMFCREFFLFGLNEGTR